MKVIHAHIDVRMISLAIGVNSLSLPVMRKIVNKIFDYFSHIYKLFFVLILLENFGRNWHPMVFLLWSGVSRRIYGCPISV